MHSHRATRLVAIALLLVGSSLSAQHTDHDMAGLARDSTPSSTFHMMAQAIPLVTRAAPSAGGASYTEATLTQALLMFRAGWWKGHARIDAALNGEGLTMKHGELNTGSFGEGFVDRRHPHTYIHEMMLTGLGAAGPLKYSVSAGRGFAAFGTDDPMMRPIVKFPINHHLSQILERGALVGAARLGVLTLEASTFGGAEPSSPSALPSVKRFGDSWSVRGTLVPLASAELQASYARVASPEEPSGFGLDQRKQSISARFISDAGSRYALAEWARTSEWDHSRSDGVFAYESALVESAVRAGPFGITVRLEQTERPEEDRLLDPFRTPRPSSDLSINGITQWRVATAQVATGPVTTGILSGFPFVEIARLAATPRDLPSLFTPERLYGASRFWMLTAGFRIRVGEAHARMGRYGAALPPGPQIGAMVGPEQHTHDH